jgi:hypothetical protein
VKKYRRIHLRKQGRERENVERCKYEAEKVVRGETGQPTCFYMDADGFTDHRTKCPKTGNVKGTDYPVDSITNRCIGVEVVGGPINGTLLYFVDDFVQGGSNLMVEVLRRAVSKLRDLLAIEGLHMPTKAYFSFDNCSENKNKYLLAYFNMLVECQLFVDIEMYFLVVGHTHTPLDQYFSVLSRYVCKHSDN